MKIESCLIIKKIYELYRNKAANTIYSRNRASSLVWMCVALIWEEEGIGKMKRAESLMMPRMTEQKIDVGSVPNGY